MEVRVGEERRLPRLGWTIIRGVSFRLGAVKSPLAKTLALSACPLWHGRSGALKSWDVC